eukprot:3360420-Pleurochrysis_carterae.AAC.1
MRSPRGYGRRVIAAECKLGAGSARVLTRKSASPRGVCSKSAGDEHRRNAARRSTTQPGEPRGVARSGAPPTARATGCRAT